MSFWDEFKKLFQTNQQREEEKANKIKDAVTNEKTILGKMQELEDEYQKSLPKEEKVDLEKLFPTSLGLEKIEYDAKSDAELKSQAEKELLASVEAEKNAILKQISSQKEKAQDSKESLVTDAEDSLAKLDELYKSLKQKAESNALKRGLGRSSIIMSQISDYDKSQANSATSVQNELLTQISSVNQKIVDLEGEKEGALNQLDLNHASDLTKKIAQLQKERDAKTLEYQKYNDSVTKKEADYATQRSKDVKKYFADSQAEKESQEAKKREQENLYGYTGEKQKNYAERYNIALDFYNSLSPDIAEDALKASPNMRFYLGNYYDKLMEILKQKGSKTDRYF